MVVVPEAIIMEKFMISIGIKEKSHGNLYSRPLLETGYTDVSAALDSANKVIADKFGSATKLESVREHRKHRRE
jgi:hypothetical protein